ncbi:F-box protein CPR30 [Morella rubra]|uniref:F-box protein CPR30 n=1 Tax=Morella rubra TaxID=262757 RepID=A0A6A1VMX9_9ROSI|nr:F-box protein CPR30 [Morella rubra]
MEKCIENEKGHRYSESSIPLDIALDILPRLSYKSLQRFKSVSREWSCLISTPQFLRKNYLLTTNASKDSSLWKCMYVASRGSALGSGPFVLETSDCNGSTREVRVGRLTSTSEFNFLGSCNGLLLLSRGRDLFIWNPSSGKKKLVSRPRSVQARHIGMSGLAYDSSSEDYKAVFGVWCHLSGRINILFYSFRTNTWKSIDGKDLPFLCYNIREQGATVNGAPHWTFFRKESTKGSNSTIVYFDPAEEKFKELLFPVERKDVCMFALGTLGGCLSVTYPSRAGLIETWVMREYGKEESWTKLFVLPSFHRYLRPLCFTKKGEAVLMGVENNRLVLCNLRDRSETHVSYVVNKNLYYRKPKNLGVELVTYVESSDFPALGSTERSKRVQLLCE